MDLHRQAEDFILSSWFPKVISVAEIAAEALWYHQGNVGSCPDSYSCLAYLQNGDVPELYDDPRLLSTFGGTFSKDHIMLALRLFHAVTNFIEILAPDGSSPAISAMRQLALYSEAIGRMVDQWVSLIEKK